VSTHAALDPLIERNSWYWQHGVIQPAEPSGLQQVSRNAADSTYSEGRDYQAMQSGVPSTLDSISRSEAFQCVLMKVKRRKERLIRTWSGRVAPGVHSSFSVYRLSSASLLHNDLTRLKEYQLAFGMRR
jgi:hypothetical protein